MSVEGWTVFALFWVVFVTTPGPNHVNCITNGMTVGFRRGLWGVAAILTQATLFLTLSAAGITALIAASPAAFEAAKLLGAGVLIWLGVRGWMRATAAHRGGRAKRRVGLLAGLHGGHDQPQERGGLPRRVQPIRATGCADLGADVGDLSHRADHHGAELHRLYRAWRGAGAGGIGAVVNVWLRRAMGAAFVIYGVALGSAATPGRV